MKKNVYRPVPIGLAIATLLLSALAATSYPAHAALSAHAAIGSNTPVPGHGATAGRFAGSIEAGAAT